MSLSAAGSITDGNSGSNYTVSYVANTAGVISARAITVTASANSKVYDGTTTAAGTPTITSGSLVTGDTGVFSETYSTRNAGTGLSLSAAGSITDGNSGSNYTVSYVANTTGVITARAITVTATTNTKNYDDTTAATAVPTVSGGSVVAGDTAAFTETYNTSAVGTGLTLTAAGSVNDGNSGNNYAVSFVPDTTGVISNGTNISTSTSVVGTPEPVEYGNSLTFTATVTATGGGVAPSAGSVDFWDVTTGTNLGDGDFITGSGLASTSTLTVIASNASGFKVSAGDSIQATYVAGNGFTGSVGTTTEAITARAITVTAATNSKIYDGTTTATAMPTITGGLATGDTAVLSETYSTKNAGTGLSLSAAGSITDGNSGSNYTVTYVADTTGVISARAITVTAAANSKVYDGTTAAAGTPTITSGSLVTGDTGVFSETYSTRNAGTGLSLSAAGSITDGNSGSNYTVTYVADTTGVITARAITVTAAANSKVYDGTTVATGTPTITSGSLVTGDTGVFSETYSAERRHQLVAECGRLDHRRQQRQQLHGELRGQYGGRNLGPSDHGHGVGELQGLRRYDHGCGHAHDHVGQPGHRRHGRLQRDVQHAERRHRVVAECGRLHHRWQQRQQLHGNLRGQYGGRDFGPGDHGYRGSELQDLRRDDRGCGHAHDHVGQPGHRRHGRLQRDVQRAERRHQLVAECGRLDHRRQQRQQLHGELRGQHGGRNHGPGDHGHRGSELQDLRRDDRGCGHAHDHVGQPGHRRHGRLQRDVQRAERRHRVVAQRRRLHHRRQQRQQLHGNLRGQYGGRDFGPGDHGHGGGELEGLRRHDRGHGYADDHVGQPGHGRHGRLQRDVQYEERGHWFVAECGRLDHRR